MFIVKYIECKYNVLLRFEEERERAQRSRNQYEYAEQKCTGGSYNRYVIINAS